MKNLSKLFLLAIFAVGLVTAANAQMAAQMPRASQRAEVWQTVGDARVGIVYHRPSMNKRKVFGAGKDFLVPYGEIWRTGANENTTFETSEDILIEGQKLAAGKYGLHMIPTKDEWTVIFSKVNNEWGSFTYKMENDALRVKVKPVTATAPKETMIIEFAEVMPTQTKVVLYWDTTKVPFMVDAGDVQTRVLARAKKAVTDAPADNQQAMLSTRMTAANYIIDNKIKASYAEAASWIDEALKMRETFGTLRAKARISAEMGDYKNAVMYGEKALEIGKAAKPPINADFMANYEKDLAGWREKNK